MKKFLLTTIIFLALFYAVDAHAGIIIRPVFHTGLVGYWDFQEGAGMTAYDKSGKDNDGTLTNMEESDWKDGKIGKALSFDGSSEYVSCGTDSSLNPTTAITVAAWIKLGTYDDYYMAIVAKDQTYIAYWLGLRQTTGVPEFIISANGSTYVEAYGATALSDGVWYHVVGVYNGTDMRVYLNGALDINGVNNPKSYSSGIYNSSGRLRISGSDGWANNEFNGIIDEVRIYNRALSESEIQRLYKLSQPTVLSAPRTGLVGYWPFEEGTGTKAGDHSGNGNHGDLQNMEQSDWVDGKLGKALDFDGSNEYVVKTNPSWDFTGNPTNTFSLSAWFKPDACVDLSGVELSLAGAGSLRLFSRTTGAYWGFQIQNGTTYSVSANNTCVIGQWQHLVGVYDAAAVKIYLYYNGNLVDSDTPGTNTSAISDGLAIGNAQNYFNGLIDEVRVYNRVLETSEIQALYKSGLAKINTSQNTKLTDGLVGLWSFNGPDIDGDTAYDRSGQGNHGTLTGGPTRAIGKVGQALEFDGVNNYVIANSVGDGDESTWAGITLTAWVKHSSYSPTAQEIIRFGESWIGNDVNLQTRGFAFSIFWPQIKAGDGGELIPNLNRWYHVVGTYDKANVILYVDGIEIDREPGTANLPNLWSFSFPRAADPNRKVTGLIDEVRIYNKALTAQEIQRLYNMGR